MSCSGDCLFCALYGGGCLAGKNDDDYVRASNTQLIERLQKYERKYSKFEPIDYRKNPMMVKAIIEDIKKLREELNLKEFEFNDELLTSFLMFSLDEVMKYANCGNCLGLIGEKRFAKIIHSLDKGFDMRILCEKCFNKAVK